MAQRTLVAHQPTYVPYLGLLPKAARADVFVIQDDLRYVKDEVGNRNRIREGDGSKWLTIPVHKSDSSTFATVTPAEPAWPETHRRFPTHAYGRAPHFSRFEELYERNATNRAAALSVVNVGSASAVLRSYSASWAIRDGSKSRDRLPMAPATPRRQKGHRRCRWSEPGREARTEDLR